MWFHKGSIYSLDEDLKSFKRLIIKETRKCVACGKIQLGCNDYVCNKCKKKHNIDYKQLLEKVKNYGRYLYR